MDYIRKQFYTLKERILEPRKFMQVLAGPRQVGHRLACVRTILANREAGAALADPAKAWPRNVDSMRCRMCDYCGFCLQGGRPDPDALPEGFISRRHGTQEEQPQG